MLQDKDNLSKCVYGGESSHVLVSQEILENPDEKNRFLEKGIDFLGDSEICGDGSQSKPSKPGNSGSHPQELTLSYLCDNNSKLGFPEKDIPGKNLLNSFGKISYKGKEVVSEDQSEDDCRWVERDFLRLNEIKGNSLKREVKDEEIHRENRDKKPKLETLNLSLALPDISLSLAASNPVQKVDLPVQLRPSRSAQSLEPSNGQAPTFSNDFTAASLSYSYSHQFSHNPSCSLTRISTENYEYSVGSHRRDCDQIWNCGEGTNGSVHSRFRPVGDGVVLANQGNQTISKDPCNSLYQTTSSDNVSFLPSELPARPRVNTHSGDSRGGDGSKQLRALENSDGGRARKLSRPERILREIVSESVPVVAQMIQELPDETVESTKEYLKKLSATPEKRNELAGLQKRLERRSDLTRETLSKSNKYQLEILVAIKMGLGNFLSKTRLPSAELLEIFLLERCRNVNCKRLLPVDDCDCKICSTKKGFCSECMCPVCLNFDCANNTCSWVGCDVCSHWCHAKCGIERNLIKPGPSLKGPTGTTEMQFNCLGCGHSSEMFGFVKDVFMACAKSWGAEPMIKELDCVRKIFGGSEDFKGKELHVKAGEMISKLEKKMISPSDVCSFIFQFFNGKFYAKFLMLLLQSFDWYCLLSI